MLTAPQARTLIGATQEDPNGPLYSLALTSGLRNRGSCWAWPGVTSTWTLDS